jgi:ABC-type transport system involved in cytochrome c biogenesis ATPase subunit
MATSSSSAVLEFIEVRGLFGRLNYKIAVDRHFPTVLTGANGTGKSTILRLVHAIASGDLTPLLSAPIREMRLSFLGEPDLSISRLPKDQGVHVKLGDNEQNVRPYDYSDLPPWVSQALRDFDPEVEDLEHRLLFYARGTGLSPSLARTMARRIENRSDVHAEKPEWLADLQRRFQVLYVTDQRLVIGDATDPRRARYERDRVRYARQSNAQAKTQFLAVEAASEDIAERVSQAGLAYARESQQIDRSFPNEVIRSMQMGEDVSSDEVNDLNGQVTRQRDVLKQIGLLSQTPGYIPPMDTGDSLSTREVRTAVAAVLRSDLRKLNVLIERSGELSSFKTFLERRLSPKRVEFGPQGIQVSLPGGRTVGVSELSSGEQHLLVLAYELQFRAAQGTLVIIDEPELSLHVQWQASLLGDLLAMGEHSNLQYLMATHSPTLVASMPHAERSLDELAQ